MPCTVAPLGHQPRGNGELLHQRGTKNTASQHAASPASPHVSSCLLLVNEKQLQKVLEMHALLHPQGMTAPQPHTPHPASARLPRRRSSAPRPAPARFPAARPSAAATAAFRVIPRRSSPREPRIDDPLPHVRRQVCQVVPSPRPTPRRQPAQAARCIFADPGKEEHHGPQA